MTIRHDVAIARGLALLDEKVGPGWEQRIDLEKLRLSSCKQCVVGQLFDEYDKGADILGFELGSRYGFDVGMVHAPQTVWSEYQALTRAWKRAIRARRAEAARP